MPQIISCHVSAFHPSLLGVFVLLSAKFAIYFNRTVYACDISAHVLFSFLLVCHELGLFLQQVKYNARLFRHSASLSNQRSESQHVLCEVHKSDIGNAFQVMEAATHCEGELWQREGLRSQKNDYPM